jgi:hypothetical protein
MKAELLSPDDLKWRQCLDLMPHDAYHLPEYARVAGHYECGEPVAFYVGEEQQSLLMPMLLRPLPPELGAPPSWRDATSPYGYSGPIATEGIPTDVLRCALLSLCDHAREHEIVSAFIRLNPFRSVPMKAFDDLGIVVKHGSVVYVDLAKSPDEWWAETRSGHRENISRLMRLGYSAEMDDWSAYPAFRVMYGTTMQRRSASAFYYFSGEYFDELREMLGDHLHLCTVRGPAGDVAAGGLFMLADGIAEYHLSATADAHLAKAPSKLMLDFVRRWAKEHGASLLNLGGGLGGSADSLHQFKAGFSQSQAGFHTVRIVFDNDRYEHLTSASSRLHSVNDARDVFFPSYRQPHNGSRNA